MNTITPTCYDVIVVGSGPGGASVARDMARRGARVLILEQGSAAPITGTLGQMAMMAAVPGRGAFFNQDGSLLVRALTAGGSSAINFATAMPPPLAQFAALGVDLQGVLAQLQAELPMAPLPDALIGPMAKRIMQAARQLGHDWHKLDKMIYPEHCRTGCWRCTYGCPYGAKWTARNFLDDAIAAGAKMIDMAKARKVILQNGRAIGIEYSHQRQLHQVTAKSIILAGGGIGSPRLLHASGLAAAGQKHFTDPVLAVMGSVDGINDINAGAEVPMAGGMHLADAGIMLADMTLPRPMYQAFALQVGRIDRLLAHHKTLTIMVKVRDALGGHIGQRWVNKTLQAPDREKLKQGSALARSILTQAGAKHLFQSWHFAAHPGGSVRIGEGVDSNLQTATPNLFVCDASVIPGPWGLPPTLTLLCLGKRLAAHLAGNNPMDAQTGGDWHRLERRGGNHAPVAAP